MPDNSGAVDLGARPDKEKEAPESQETQESAGPQKVITAFMVLVDIQGNPSFYAFEDESLDPVAELTPDLVYGACATIVKDITAAETAQASALATQQLMMQQARALAEQQQAAHIQQSIGNLRA